MKTRSVFAEYYVKLSEKLESSPEEFGDLLQEAVASGFPVDYKGGTYTMLQRAAAVEGAYPALGALVSCGADIDKRWNNGLGESGTALHLCLYTCRFQNFAYLVNAGGGIEEKDDDGRTPLTLSFVLYIRFGIEDFLRWGFLMLEAGCTYEGPASLDSVPCSLREHRRLDYLSESIASYKKDRLLLGAFGRQAEKTR